MHRRNLLKLVFALTFASTAALAQAQQWPSGPVKLIVPFAAGSTPDLLARVVGERLGARLGQPIVVENKPGASGNIGTNAIAKAPADGLTIGVSVAGPLAVNALLYKKMPYDTARELEPITVAATQPAVLVTSSKFGASSVNDLLARLKKNPGKYSFSSIGAGTASHLAMELLSSITSANLVHVPYNGSGAAVTALIAGDVDMAVLPAAAVMPHVKTGKLTALAIASAKRSTLLSDLPTLAEAGVPEVQADAWIGVVVPAKTAPDIVSRLRAEIVQIMAEPAVQEKLRAQYMEPVANTPAQFRGMLAAEVVRWKPVIQKHSITLD
ncbi:MAG: tripartite tricarboxylate transporter substrate binding protein [Burkholderiaceae bacterium]|nr:tripartite tricarboxylate transporter substrate binding protein [Burkholderiaceae bacterium]